MCHLLCGGGTTLSVQVAYCQIITIKCGKRGYKIQERIEEEAAGIGASFMDDVSAES